MRSPSASNIRIVGCDGSIWHVHGEGKGAEGVALSIDGVDGLYDTPVTTQRRAPMRARGSQYRAKTYGPREVDLTFHAIGDQLGSGASFEFNEASFREAFDYEPDPWDPDARPARIEWDTDLSGTRWLDVLLREQTDSPSPVDPIIRQHAKVEVRLVADQPLWVSTPAVTSWQSGPGTGAGFVTVSNPTDQVMYQKWVLTRGTWTLPDVSWQGKRRKRIPAGGHGTRSIPLRPITAAEGGARIDLDPMQLWARSAGDTNAAMYLAQQPGTYFMHPIPPWTPRTQLPVSVTGAPAGGAMVQCHQPRMWSKPWGVG